MYSYSPVGDITVIAICIVMIVLIFFSFVQKSRSFKLFLSILGAIIVAATADITMHMIAEAYSATAGRMAMLVRCLFHLLLAFLFVLFAHYICEVARFVQKQKRGFLTAAWIIFVLSVAVDILHSVLRFPRLASGPAALYSGRSIFVFSYIAFLILMLIMLIAAVKRIYIRILLGFYGSIALSLILLLVQVLMKNSSYMVLTFFFPAVAMFYTMHANPYNAELGSVGAIAFESFVKENYEGGKQFVFLDLYMRSFAEDNLSYPEELQKSIRTHATGLFRHTLLFRLAKGHVVLCALKHHNKDYKERIKGAIKEFEKEYEKFKFDYKLIVGESMDVIGKNNEYIAFFMDIIESMEENSIHYVSEKDLSHYEQSEKLQKLLEDIHQKRDLNDPRVLAYCQPVFNIQKDQYDTAEALMRLDMDGQIVSPNLFIPVAEKNGYIHTLSEIILYKTCREIKRMLDEKYDITRISVNISVLEMKEESFTEDITRIIKESQIPEGKVAIELTESQSDSDFRVMKQKVNELKEQGIKFYLDDFGTGYSNMKRIVELPFDIIKFDRSLVLSSENNEKARLIVGSLASMFAAMDYSVLYEGVEKENDVQMCTSMSASYLQGYLYSKPVPICELRNYFQIAK